MKKKNKKINDNTLNLSNSVDNSLLYSNTDPTIITCSNSIIITSSDYSYFSTNTDYAYSSTNTDPYAELENIKQENEKEEKMRNENASLLEAWEQYQLIKKLLEEEEIDKYFDDRYKNIKK